MCPMARWLTSKNDDLISPGDMANPDVKRFVQVKNFSSVEKCPPLSVTVCYRSDLDSALCSGQNLNLQIFTLSLACQHRRLRLGWTPIAQGPKFHLLRFLV
jgi:hypothetical protein